MRLLMVSGDRQVTIGERGPFDSMQEIFSTWFERIDVICPRPPKPPTIFTIHDNVHFHPADCGRFGMVKHIMTKGRELLGAHGHAMIVSHDYGWFYNGIGSARLARASAVPYLSELHHVPGHPVPADLRERLDKYVARRYVNWARHRTAGFRVVNSTEMPDLLRSWGVPDEQILVLPSLYIDLETFCPERGPNEFDQDVLYVGRMVNNKGLDRIVDALAMLKRRGLPHRAHFVGKGPMAGKLQRMLQDVGLTASTQITEWVATPQDLANLYRRSRVAVCASTCEGGPRVTVEAMACGTPVVSTPVGVMTELLRSGEAGSLCDFTARGLCDALHRILEDAQLRDKLGQRAQLDVQRFERSRALEVYARGILELTEACGGQA